MRALLAALVLAQICYPLTAGTARAAVVILTVLLGYALSVAHAALTRGPRTAVALVLVTTGGGLAIEALGVATGVPFGGYAYSGELGPKLAGVPVVIPLAWTWMAWLPVAGLPDSARLTWRSARSSPSRSRRRPCAKPQAPMFSGSSWSHTTSRTER